MIRVLYLDDHPSDRRATRAALERDEGGFQVFQATCRADFEAALAQGEFDLLLIDPDMAGFQELEALDLARSACPRLPVVLLMAESPAKVAVEAMRRGAADVRFKSTSQFLELPKALLKILEERRRADSALYRQVQELTLLHAVAIVASTASSENELILETARIIRETFPITNLSVGFVDEETGLLRRHPHFEYLDGKKDVSLPLGEGITGWVAKHGKSRRISDARLESGYYELWPDTRSELCVPLKTSTRVIGVINAESDQVDAFSEEDERLLTTLAGQLANAIERIRFFEQTQRQAKELAGLYHTALATSSVLETKALLRCIYEQVQQLMAPDTFLIVMYEEELQRCHVALGIENGQDVSGEWDGHIPLEEAGLTGWVLRNRQTLLIGDMEKNHLPTTPKHGARPGPLVAGNASDRARDQLIGAISVQSFQPHFFNENDRRFLESLAVQVAVALNNSCLFDETRRRLAELEAVSKISSAIRSARTLDDMLSLLIDETLATLDAQAGAIWLYDPNRNELSNAVARGWFTQTPSRVGAAQRQPGLEGDGNRKAVPGPGISPGRSFGGVG